MGIVFRQSVKTSLITFAGAILGGLVLLLSTHYIPKQYFGFRTTLTNQAILISQILLIGFHSTLAVYIHRYGTDDPRRPALISISLFIPGLLLVVITPFYFLFKPQIVHLFQPQDIPLLLRYFAWLPLFTLFVIYHILLEQYLISQLKVAAAGFMREILLRLLNVAVIILYGTGCIGLDLLIYSTVLLYLLPNGILFLLARQTAGFSFTHRWKVFSKEELREMIHFTWFHSLLTISVNLMGYLDVLMLAALAPQGLAATPAYAVAVFIMSFAQIPYRVMVNTSFPVVARAYQEKNMDEVRDLFKRSSINMLFTTILMIVLICCNLSNAAYFLPKGYEAFSTVVLILAIGRFTDAATGMNDQVLSISSYYKFSFYISMGLVALLVLFNFLFIPRYGIYGAAWASSLALTLYNLAKLLFVWAKLGLQPFSRKSALALVAGGAAAGIGYIIPFIYHPVADAFVRSAVICGVYGCLTIFFNVSPDLNHYLATVRKNKRLF